MDLKQIFQYASYLQYPLMLAAIYFAIKPYFNGIEAMIENIDETLNAYNSTLIFMGLGIGFSTLQDTTKTQNNFSKKIWESPKKGKIAIIIISFMTLFFVVYGMILYFASDYEKLKSLSTGTIIFGIGMLGFLKTALEVFENHRKDKKVLNDK